MPKYRIQTPDGKTLLYDVPAGVTAAQALAHAQQSFGAKPTMPSVAPAQPRVQTRQQAIQQTARDAITARENGNPLGKGAADIADGITSAFNSATFGLPNHLAAAARTYVPGLRNGNSYSDNIDLANEVSRQQASNAPVSNILANIGTSVLSGRAEVAGAKAVAGRLAASGAPAVAKVGNFLQRVVPLAQGSKAAPLRVGQKIANAAKVVATGAGTGAAQAAGTGDDVATGAALGTAGAAGAHAVGLAAGFLSRPVRDLLGRTNAAQYLRRFTSAPMDQIQQKAAQFRTDTGAEPTLFELLPLADRNNLIKRGIATRDSTVEQASNAIRDRVGNVGPEMQDVVNSATGPDKLATQRQMVRDLATARGGADAPVRAPGDAALALRASNSPTDMQAFRREEARLIMAPHDNTNVVDNFGDLIPQHPVQNANGSITQVETDPEISSAIRSVAGTSRMRPQDQGYTVQDITNMISDLREDAGRGGIEGRNAANAADHLLGVLQENAPDAAAAANRMNDAWASRSRMIEGMKAGSTGNLRDEIQVGTNQGQGNLVRNAYDSQEGTLGRQLGQQNSLNSDLGARPEDALRSTVDLSRGGSPAVEQNLGADAADRVRVAAQAQDQSAQALASATKAAGQGGEEPASALALGHALAALSPHTFATTKFGMLQKLTSMSFMPENRAKTLVDMLFSQDPTLTNRAINALNGSSEGTSALAGLVPQIVGAHAATAAGAAPGATLAPDDDPNAPPAPQAAPALDSAAQDPNAPPPVQAPAAAPGGPADPNGYSMLTEAKPVDPSQSQYMPALQHIYDNDDPNFLNFVESHQKQESGGQQFDKNGRPLTSKAGAVGIMQIEPDTAKVIAKRAGIPYDPIALQYDPAYNKLLGTVHVAHLLQKYGGDTRKASAAYNAGEGAVDRATGTDGSLNIAALPQETQDYVPAVAG